MLKDFVDTGKYVIFAASYNKDSNYYIAIPR
jgi:hypothetical protein